MTKRDDAASGKRDRRITLVPRETATGSSGYPVESDGVGDIELWVSKEDVSGRERFTADQHSAPYDTRWVAPYGAAFDPDLVDVPKVFALEHKGRRLDIVQASHIGRCEAVEFLTLGRMG